MTTSQVVLEEGKTSVNAGPETAVKTSSALDPSAMEWVTHFARFGDSFLLASSGVKGVEAPDDDLTADEWELAKAAVMKAVADRLDKPDDFLADIRARIANI